jgi:hypothetical protein
MIARRDTLEQALSEIEVKGLSGVSTIVVSRRWWTGLSARERDAYQSRAERTAVELRADDRLSSHFVELRGDQEDPPLSSEHPM